MAKRPGSVQRRSPRSRTRTLALAMIFPALAVVGACESSVAPEGTARVQVLLKDDPAEIIESAVVRISHVYLVGGGEGRVDLFHDAEDPHEFDLLELQDGIVADLTGEAEVPPGRYGQLRLVVDDAEITLAEPYTFADGEDTRTLQVPSGAQAGIRVLLTGEIEAEEGSLTTVLVDFDVYENFVIQGSVDSPAGIQGILFTPVLKEENRSTQ